MDVARLCLLFKMGRPKLYHTPEEKRQANRVKSKHYYDKYVTSLFLKLVAEALIGPRMLCARGEASSIAKRFIGKHRVKMNFPFK